MPLKRPVSKFFYQNMLIFESSKMRDGWQAWLIALYYGPGLVIEVH